MLPFQVVLTSGESPFRQVVYAATKAVVSGELPQGTAFPSVRELSQALKINPNTAHKVVAELTRQGMLLVMPGLGTVVAGGRAASAAERAALLSHEVEQLVVEAKRLGLGESDLLHALSARWSELSRDPAALQRSAKPQSTSTPMNEAEPSAISGSNA